MKTTEGEGGYNRRIELGDGEDAGGIDGDTRMNMNTDKSNQR